MYRVLICVAVLLGFSQIGIWYLAYCAEGQAKSAALADQQQAPKKQTEAQPRKVAAVDKAPVTVTAAERKASPKAGLTRLRKDVPLSPAEKLKVAEIETLEKMIEHYEQVTSKSSWQQMRVAIRELNTTLVAVNLEFNALSEQHREEARVLYSAMEQEVMSRLIAAKARAHKIGD